MTHLLRTVLLVFSIAVVGGSCGLAPPPGKPLVDGCYYAGSVAVLKVQGDKGTLMVPGDIQTVHVKPDASTEQAGVTFTPGFRLHRGPPLTVSLVKDMPESSMMMKPYSDRPTIMAITEPMGLIDIVQGPPC